MDKFNKRLFIGKKELAILESIAKFGLVTASLAAPNIIQLYPYLFPKKSKREKSYFHIKIKELAREDIIFLGGEKVELTKKGRDLLRINQDFSIDSNQKKWDGVWRVIAYDIPKHKSSERHYFQRKLQKSGFVQMQKSLWIIPYECQEEIAVFAQSLGISPFVAHMVTNQLPQNDRYLKLFNLDDYFFTKQP